MKTGENLPSSIASIYSAGKLRRSRLVKIGEIHGRGGNPVFDVFITAQKPTDGALVIGLEQKEAPDLASFDGEERQSITDTEPFQDVVPLPRGTKAKSPIGETGRKKVGGDGQNALELAYAKRHGVRLEDLRAYQTEFKKISHLVKPVWEVLERLVSQREAPDEDLRSGYESGVMPDPGLIAVTAIEARMGRRPQTLMQYDDDLSPSEKVIPTEQLWYILADLSWSTGQGRKLSVAEGGKIVGHLTEKERGQRAAVMAFLESLNYGQDLIARNQRLGDDIRIYSSLRCFGVKVGEQTITQLRRPISSERVTEAERIGIFRGLHSRNGGTNDHHALGQIRRELEEEKRKNPAFARDVESGKIQVKVLVFTDGESGDPFQVQEELRELNALGKGVNVWALGMTQECGQIVTTYAPYGRVCNGPNDLARMATDLLMSNLAEMSLTGNPKDVLP